MPVSLSLMQPTSDFIDKPVLDNIEQCLNWTWQQVTAGAVTDIGELATLLKLDPETLSDITASNAFELRIPHTLIRRMKPGTLDDPLLLQFLNRREEQLNSPGYSNDPLGEQNDNPCPGVIHKYASRVLLTAATTCPLNCRYCFRRHFPYQDNRLSPALWQPALDYIAADSKIKEVILSGGEPLMLKDSVLQRLLEELQSIEHINLLRIHTRFPIAVPQRMTPDLIQTLTSTRIPMSVVTHCNHPQEIDQSVIDALLPLRNSSVTLLNQSVILKNINDDVEILKTLSYRLFQAGILPYYLHCQDPVAGTAHFDVGDEISRELARELNESLPGYLSPVLVREIPNKPSKTRL